MTSSSVFEVVCVTLKKIAAQQKISLVSLEPEMAIVDDLGFTSLSVIQLITTLNEQLGTDPFDDESIMATDLRTVADVCRIYQLSLEKLLSV